MVISSYLYTLFENEQRCVHANFNRPLSLVPPQKKSHKRSSGRFKRRIPSSKTLPSQFLLREPLRIFGDVLRRFSTNTVGKMIIRIVIGPNYFRLRSMYETRISCRYSARRIRVEIHIERRAFCKSDVKKWQTIRAW